MRRDDLTLPELPSNDRPGDQWMCGRGQHACSQGPSCKGVCPLAEACRPRRTWTGRRRQIVWSVLAVLALTLLVATRSSVSTTVFAPGDLSRPHAQILAGTLASQRCAACHATASTSPAIWFAAGEKSHANVGLTDRCLDCHHRTIDRDLAKSAHNLPRQIRRQIRANLRLASANSQSWHDSLPGPAIAKDDVECSACHREHRGSDASLLDLSDAQCQTCHADRFGRFATSHPDWDRWPYGRGGVIAFDHRTHMKKHYPAKARDGAAATFDCQSCHQGDETGELTRAVSYQAACQSCHDEPLRLEAAQGFDLFALPSLPSDAAQEIGNWPDAATGFADGQLAPLMEWLLRSEKHLADAMRQIPNCDFSRVGLDQDDQISALKAIAYAHRRFLREVSNAGHPLILERADAAGLAVDAVTELVRTLPPQLLSDTYRRWFESPTGVQPQAARPLGKDVRLVDFDHESTTPPSLRMAARADEELLLSTESDGDLRLPESDPNDPDADALLLGDEDSVSTADPLNDLDLLALPENAGTREQRFEPSTMLPFGGWYRDDLRLSISYRGGGHDDPVLRAAISITAHLPTNDPVRKRLLASRSIAACVSCHAAATAFPPVWKSEPLIGRSRDFTKFAHRPHLNVSQLGDCLHCHQVASLSTQDTAMINVVNAASEHHEFEPLKRAACGACHQPAAAGDSCVQCHRYHIHQ